MIHEGLKKSLVKAINTGNVFNSIIFSGPEGIGKKTLARFFSMALHCEGENKPCGKCPSCIKHKTQNHPDYKELLPEEGKKTISVSSIRKACEDLFIRPMISDKKILFIPDAELCEASSQNAMLKCFEEPPSYAVIILAVKDLSSLLETIKSRAVLYNITPCTSDEIKDFIRKYYPEKSSREEFLVAFSEGIIKKTILLCENEEFESLRRDFITLFSDLYKGKYSAFKISDFILKNQDKENFLFEVFISVLRDLVCIKKSFSNLINNDFYKNLKIMADKTAEKGASKALFMLSEAKNTKSKNANYNLWIQDIVMRLWEVLYG